MGRIRILNLFVLTFISTWSFAQIKFQTTDLPTVLKMARAENKLVFVDCYTDWCVPCKWMDGNVFNKKEVGEKINQKFISLKLNMESEEGKKIGVQYKIGAYPSFLILDHEGLVRYKFVGAKSDQEFLEEMDKGTLSDNPVFLMDRRFDEGDRSPAFIISYIQEKFKQKENSFAVEMAENMIDTASVETLVKEESWVLFSKHTNSVYLSPPNSKAAYYFLENWKYFVPTLGVARVQERLKDMFKDLSSSAMRGYYQKQFGYDKAVFKRYRKMSKRSGLSDRKQYTVLVDIAEYAVLGEKKKVSDIFADNIRDMTTENQRLAYDFWAFVTKSPVVPIPRLKEISDALLETSEDEFLRNTAKIYRNKVLQ